MKFTAEFRGDAPPQAAGAQYFSLDVDVEAPAAARPAPLTEVQPQGGLVRHGGDGYEVVLNGRVPRLGQDWGDLSAADEELAVRRRLAQAVRRALEREQLAREEAEAATQSRSSNKMGARGQRKKKKRRKKTVPKSSSSSLARGALWARRFAEYVGPGEDALGMEEVDKLVEEKVIRGREFILKHGLTELTLYSDRTHLYSQSSERCWLIWMKDRRRYVRRVGCSWGVDRYAAYWFRQPGLL